MTIRAHHFAVRDFADGVCRITAPPGVGRLVSEQFQPAHPAEVLRVVCDQREFRGERSRCNPQIIRADDSLFPPQLDADPRVAPDRCRIHGQHIEAAQHRRTNRVINFAEACGELAGDDPGNPRPVVGIGGEKGVRRSGATALLAFEINQEASVEAKVAHAQGSSGDSSAACAASSRAMTSSLATGIVGKAASKSPHVLPCFSQCPRLITREKGSSYACRARHNTSYASRSTEMVFVTMPQACMAHRAVSKTETSLRHNPRAAA